MAYVADLVLPQHRAAAFGLILCSFSVGILVGPLGGGYITPPVASIAALVGLCFCVLYVVLLIPESSSAEARQKVTLQAYLVIAEILLTALPEVEIHMRSA